MWGKEDKDDPTKTKVGITPTHVGKRSTAILTRAIRGDHPHPCGEKFKCEE